MKERALRQKSNTTQISDHYNFMFELMRRFKQRVKRITDAQGHIVLSKFFKEFPRIAKNMNDVNLIAE